MNAGNKNTPSTHHPRRRNVTTLMVGLKKRSHTQKSHPKVVNPRDIAGERHQKKKKKKRYLPMHRFTMTGNPDTDSRRGSCSHTGLVAGESSWWQVDLAGGVSVFDVFSVIITNRGDCCGECRLLSTLLQLILFAITNQFLLHHNLL